METSSNDTKQNREKQLDKDRQSDKADKQRESYDTQLSRRLDQEGYGMLNIQYIHRKHILVHCVIYLPQL
jgi:hypothetical protein